MSLFKGWIGEKKTAFRLWLWLDSKDYHRFHNLILPSSNGTSQLDHIIVSKYGVFIIETKNKSGWIYGSESQAKWTQVIYRNKYSFQNPLRQVYRQKKVLSQFLGLTESAIHTVVFFIGDCRFKTQMPSNVIDRRLTRYVKRFREPILSRSEVERIIGELSQHNSESTISGRDHLRSLRERHTSNTVCPKCGSDLIVRTARRGPNAGGKFLGCRSYPRCKFTKEL